MVRAFKFEDEKAAPYMKNQSLKVEKWILYSTANLFLWKRIPQTKKP